MQKSERMGLGMLAASLVVMGVVGYLYLLAQTDSRLEQVRGQGVAVARVLSGMSLDELVPDNGQQGILQALRYTHSHDDFAYVAVVDPSGQPKAMETASGVIVPQSSLPQVPSAWLGEREIPGAPNDGTFLEFHAPVITEGSLDGYVRLGYKKPELGLDSDRLSSMAQLGLVVFLLMPMFYFLLRRETASLRSVSERIDQVVEEGAFKTVELAPNEQMSDFITRFNSFVDKAQERIHQLEDEHDQMETSNKLLAYRQGRIEAILRTMPDAIMVLDESGVISFANERIGGVLNVNHEEVVGHRPADFFNNAELLGYLSPRGNTGRMGFVTDSVRFSPTGHKEHLLEVRAYPLFSPRQDDELLGTLVVFHDIAEEHAAKQNRGEFVAQVAHELKTPLNVLSMYSEMLLGEDARDEGFRVEAINTIRDEVERLASLINNMLALSKFELGGMALERGRVRLGDLLQDAFDNVSQSALGRGLDMHIEVPREISAINVDKDMLRIAINNLLTNAIKYNREGGKVVLEAQEAVDAIEIRVTDTGLGISAEEQALIFNKFYRSEDQQVQDQQGHGLGLPLAMQIVKLHHGSITVESAPGKGSTFHLRLPKDSANVLQVASA